MTLSSRTACAWAAAIVAAVGTACWAGTPADPDSAVSAEAVLWSADDVVVADCGAPASHGSREFTATVRTRIKGAAEGRIRVRPTDVATSLLDDEQGRDAPTRPQILFLKRGAADGAPYECFRSQDEVVAASVAAVSEPDLSRPSADDLRWLQGLDGARDPARQTEKAEPWVAGLRAGGMRGRLAIRRAGILAHAGEPDFHGSGVPELVERIRCDYRAGADQVLAALADRAAATDADVRSAALDALAGVFSREAVDVAPSMIRRVARLGETCRRSADLAERRAGWWIRAGEDPHAAAAEVLIALASPDTPTADRPAILKAAARAALRRPAEAPKMLAALRAALDSDADVDAARAALGELAGKRLPTREAARVWIDERLRAERSPERDR